jgi:cysteine-rich repeat protein
MVETCVTEDMIAACVGLPELARCDEDDRKHCIDSVCIDACGNDHIDPGETCDDGNKLSGDDCSDRCIREFCGSGVVDSVLGEQCDDGVVGVSGDGCSSTCQLEIPVWTELEAGPMSARADLAMTYAGNGRILAFGGLVPTGALDETWSWSAASSKWTRLSPAASPSPRHGHSMAYDSVRDRVVLFGGVSQAGILGDTWEWDGLTWTNVTPQPSPPARKDTQIAFDAVRHKTVLYGGNDYPMRFTDTWEWDGSTWTDKTTSIHPLIAFGAQLAFDENTGEMIYCGGEWGQNDETFAWNGTMWTTKTAPCPAPTLFNRPNRLVYDRSRLKLVLFDGGGAIYEWTGSAWQQASTGTSARWYPGVASDNTRIVVLGGHATGNLQQPPGYLADSITRDNTATVSAPVAAPVDVPPPRQDGAIAYATNAGHALMFGGTVNGAAGSGETWLLDRVGWSSQTGGPAPRIGPALAYDSVRRRVVMFGGVGYSGFRDTWEHDGTAWTDATTAIMPSHRMFAGMAYDTARDQLVLFGGKTSGPPLLGDTWLRTGVTWTQATPASSPSPRFGYAMAYDPRSQRVLLFGGDTGFSDDTFAVADLWEWDGSTWHDITPTGTGPAARVGASLVYDPLRKRMVLLGGRTSSLSLTFGFFGDAWEWDGTSWTEVHDDPRLARSGQQAFFDPVRGGVVVFGGATGTTGTSDQTWILRRESLSPREDCRLVEDRDRDTLAGCDDPDCWGRCSPTCPPDTSCAASSPRCGDAACDPIQEDRLICPDDC